MSTRPPGTTRSATEIETYRYLRIGLVVLVLLLAFAVIAASISAGCTQTSISGYWYTPARSVFVGVLYALGAALVVYKGDSAVEDVLLDVAGFAAVVVATVPTAVSLPACGPLDLTDPAPGVNTAVPAIAAAAVLAGVLIRALGGGTGGIALAGLGALTLATHLLVPATFLTRAHAVAAVTLFGAIIVVVVLQSARSDSRGYRVGYVLVAAAMALTLLGTVIAHLTLTTPGPLLLIVETVLLVEFSIYWILQTRQRWAE